MTVDQVIERILDEEGFRFTNDPLDPGGPTKYGITQNTLAAWRGRAVTADDVRALLMDEAAKIYRKRYYLDPGFDQVNELSPAIAGKLTDAGVNEGAATVLRFFQRGLNAFNQGGKAYADIGVDGKMSPEAMAALKAFLGVRGVEGETVLVRTINCLQGARYIELTERNPLNERFTFGWISKRIS
jgi:lysozyme family protein